MRCQGLRLRAVTIDLAIFFFAFLVSYMPLANQTCLTSAAAALKRALGTIAVIASSSQARARGRAFIHSEPLNSKKRLKFQTSS